MPISKASTNKINIGMISLGCPKTLVDSEIILGKLDRSRFGITTRIEETDIALLNTCTFIQDAKQESIDHIMQLLDLKERGELKALVVMGCLVQQYPKALQDQLKEVDAFIGSGDYAKIPELIDKVCEGSHYNSVGEAGYLSTAGEERVALTPDHSRYLKISEGCDHICTFCTIPQYRGKHRSRTIADVVAEAQKLRGAGTKELILTGQDTTYFGRDHGGNFLLPQLLQELEQIDFEWIRILYAYPSCLPTELMEVMRDSKRVCHYLDMPLQHASDKMLTAMKRGITKRRTLDLIRKFREHVSDLVIRTTFIVGFPGETQRDFEELLEFIQEVKFGRVGVFKYSEEEDAEAAKLPNHVPDNIKEKRYHELMKVQQKISHDFLESKRGETLKVLIEEKSKSIENGWIGRSYMDAPEIDGCVLVNSKNPLEVGQFYSVNITESKDYDLVGSVQ